METNDNVRDLWQDKYGDHNPAPAEPAEIERLMRAIQPVLKRNRRNRRTRKALRSAGVFCSVGFFILSTNIFGDQPLTPTAPVTETVQFSPVINGPDPATIPANQVPAEATQAVAVTVIQRKAAEPLPTIKAPATNLALQKGFHEKERSLPDGNQAAGGGGNDLLSSGFAREALTMQSVDEPGN